MRESSCGSGQRTLNASIQQSSGRIDSGSYAVKRPRAEPGGGGEDGEDVNVEGEDEDEDVKVDGEDVKVDDEDVNVDGEDEDVNVEEGLEGRAARR